ncbi:MAG: superoxide dismutase [Candidatus Dependentiae bacterium]|nr:superoxide dismutase [Candidatus Dependentiae bacterium]
MIYKYTLPVLPYDYGALEPYIDARTMEIHHTKHHQAYVDNLNKALEGYPQLQTVELVELLAGINNVPEDIKTAVRNHGGGHANHTFFWKIMKKNGGGEPSGKIAEVIKKNYGSFAKFQDDFNATAKKVFGSGWAWLCINDQRKVSIISTPNQDSPIMQGLVPLLGLDVWEHAYYLSYQNRRPDYITAWWQVINWEQVEENLQQAL